MAVATRISLLTLLLLCLHALPRLTQAKVSVQDIAMDFVFATSKFGKLPGYKNTIKLLSDPQMSGLMASLYMTKMVTIPTKGFTVFIPNDAALKKNKISEASSMASAMRNCFLSVRLNFRDLKVLKKGTSEPTVLGGTVVKRSAKNGKFVVISTPAVKKAGRFAVIIKPNVYVGKSITFHGVNEFVW